MQMAQPFRVGVANAFTGTVFLVSGTPQIALSTADPTYDISGLAEPVGAGYARQNLVMGSPTTVGNVRIVSNTSPVTFNATGGNWGTITHAVLYKGSTALWQGPLNAQKLVNNGNSISFAAGTIQPTVGAAYSNYLGDLILNKLFGGAPFGGLSSYRLALSTSDPLPDGSGLNEPSGGYSRQEITLTQTSNTSLGIVVSNSNAAVFGPATVDWGNITHAAIFDAPTGGNIYAYGPVAVQRNVVTGDSYAVPANSVAMTIR